MTSTAACPWTFRPLEKGATESPYNNRELLPDWTESVTHCVAMAGARNSGKSLYTAVMVKQLKQLAHKHDHSVLAADESTAQRYAEKYENPLFKEMQSMEPTPSAVATDAYQRDPLIFDLGRWPDAEGVMRTNYLVFRDVAGEDLENLPERGEDREALSFFKYADLVIFLFDPLRERQIRDYLHGLVPDFGELGAEPTQVLENLITLMGTECPPPLAVTISKFDTLQKLEHNPNTPWAKIMGNAGAAFRRDTGWNFHFDDSYVLHQEVDSLLRYLEAFDLINMVANVSKNGYRYFAVSALGEAPTGRHLARSGIAPFRVLDPIRTLLSGHGVFGKDVQ
ncbi:hypothetical protein WM42_1208 [Corynebacterium simulans]|uniref:TRAFAC clade GTPase domain-containing protein n=1 Tax=Corynebacterium simulans TaxID=146827 RepID=UPI000781E5C8|nr:hypothetical protein [Corynebacterium simulans]AMO88942.1 hypothetical protein WM42_1208 [Corynebacterium simulans]